MRVVLASGSPRRRQLLSWVGLDVDVAPAGIDETRGFGEDPVAYAERLAASKAAAQAGAHPDAPVVAADTVVHRSGVVFDKPADRATARATLADLSGGAHAVTTGVCVRRGERARVFHVTTQVRFRDLTPDEIAAYVATGEADDKAGAYAIQGRGGVFVAAVEGSWTNVMGLPVEETLAALGAIAGEGP